jgi:hypothetical protein
MEAYADKWTIVNVSLGPMSAEEAEERAEARAEVDDPNWLLGMADAEGEPNDGQAVHDRLVADGFDDGAVDVTGGI